MLESDQYVWDPGGSTTDLLPNNHVIKVISSAMVASASDDFMNSTADNEVEGRCELDSHANMVVLGKHCVVIENTGRVAQVNPFTPDYKALERVPIVDAAVLYVCP